jgi:undecaprenyl-diphosphatase
MVALTTGGVPLMVAAVAVQWWPRAGRERQRHVIVAAALSFVLGFGINQLILLIIHRPRPYASGLTHLLVSPSADPSFPSDHATASVAIAAAFLLGGMAGRGMAFLAAAVAVCVSRIYVGTHYFSDVVGGAATAIAAALLVRLGYRAGTRFDRLLTGLL